MIGQIIFYVVFVAVGLLCVHWLARLFRRDRQDQWERGYTSGYEQGYRAVSQLSPYAPIENQRELQQRMAEALREELNDE